MRSIELFAGAGGLGLGMEMAGFEHNLVVEFDHDACETLRHNFTAKNTGEFSWPIQETDIRKVDFREYEGRIQIVSGGPPCQPFSIGGKARGQNDRRDMFPEAARVIRETKPLVFVFENVRGLLRQSFAKYFEYIKLQLTYPEIKPVADEDWTSHLRRLHQHHTAGKYRGLHYRVAVNLVNAADYGVPQKRERVVIVGFRNDVHERWSFPSPTHSRAALEHAKWSSGEYWDRHGVAKRSRPKRPVDDGQEFLLGTAATGLSPWRTVRDAIAGLPDPESRAARLVPNHVFQPGAKAYPGHTGSPLDEPAKTLKAGDHGVPGGENMLAHPDGRIRYFTVRESARLQTFPDWFGFASSWTESMRQIGNAVPVSLASQVGVSVREALERKARQN
jgi:DNA (cytosine-5)-methyltransferase 1